MNRLLTVPQTAKVLNMSESFVRELIRTRKLAHYKIGGAVRIPTSAIREYLAEGLRDVA